MNKIFNLAKIRINYFVRDVIHCFSGIPNNIQHLPLHLKIRVNRIRNMKLQFELNYLQYIANIILLVALGIGLFDRWNHTEDTVILMLGFMGLAIFCVSCALTYYFSMEQFAASLVHLWFGCLLGVIAFTEKPQYKKHMPDQIMDIMLISSVCLHNFWSLAVRCKRTITYGPTLLTKMEMLEMLGMGIAGCMSPDWAAICLITTAFAFTIISIRLKSLLGVVNLLAMGIISILWFFPMLKIYINGFSLVCFVGRLTFEPLIDMYYSTLSTLERWRRLFDCGTYVRKLAIVAVLLLEVTMYIVVAVLMPQHKEWLLMVPMFVVFGFIWVCFHIVFIITCWQINNKISDCNAVFRSILGEDKSMNQIMASKGIRHFSLVAQRFFLCTYLTTLIVGAMGWTTRTGISVSLVFMVIAVESAILSLVNEMGCVLGGTCSAYAVVAPATYIRKPGTTVLHTGALQELGTRSTQILNAVQRFLGEHMIDTYGCDYSSSGLTLDALKSKLGLFFDRHTTDGPRYDSYIVYYSGHTLQNGDLALSDNDNLKLETLLEWWEEKNLHSGSRLILILDTEFSHKWIKPVRNNTSLYLAVQTCQVVQVKNRDPESESEINLGDFTQDWITFNSTVSDAVDINWTAKQRQIRAVYSTSRIWSDFTFRLPTQDDIAQHWNSNFPSITKPLIKAVNVCGQCDIFCCCDSIMKCLRRKKLSWCPPTVLDTGHGFKFVKS